MNDVIWLHEVFSHLLNYLHWNLRAIWFLLYAQEMQILFAKHVVIFLSEVIILHARCIQWRSIHCDHLLCHTLMQFISSTFEGSMPFIIGQLLNVCLSFPLWYDFVTLEVFFFILKLSSPFMINFLWHSMMSDSLFNGRVY